MCNASYICMCALSHMCMLIHIQKCPVTLIINPVPLLVCKEIDSYPSYSHNMLHMNAYSCVCVCSSMESVSSSKLWMCVLPAAITAKGQEGSKAALWDKTGGGRGKITWANYYLAWMSANVAAAHPHRGMEESTKWITPCVRHPHRRPEASLKILQAQ